MNIVLMRIISFKAKMHATSRGGAPHGSTLGGPPIGQADPQGQQQTAAEQQQHKEMLDFISDRDGLSVLLLQ